ncbi:hypothetical protein J3459_022590 [Metarhizium acridum]|nr:hypothetical protein J3459_022590 [Metarhizium acridum]
MAKYMRRAAISGQKRRCRDQGERVFSERDPVCCFNLGSDRRLTAWQANESKTGFKSRRAGQRDAAFLVISSFLQLVSPDGRTRRRETQHEQRVGEKQNHGNMKQEEEKTRFSSRTRNRLPTHTKKKRCTTGTLIAECIKKGKHQRSLLLFRRNSSGS